MDLIKTLKKFLGTQLNVKQYKQEFHSKETECQISKMKYLQRIFKDLLDFVSSKKKLVNNIFN